MRRLLLAVPILFVLTAPAFALFSLSGFQNTMIEFLISQLSTEGELEITVEEVTDTDDGTTSIRGLAVSDAQGVWFRADALDFSWNPSRLARGEVEFGNLEMRGVSVLRAPVVPPSDEVDTAPADADAPLIPEIAWPRSPLTLRVERLALRDVSVAEAVLGHALAFDAEGALRDEGDVQAAQLVLERTDAVAGQIALDYTRDFSTGTLSLSLDADEAPGGLIAALTGLPAEAASTLDLRADGPPTDWRLTLDLALADTVAISGAAAVSYQGPLAVDARFTARPGARLDPDIARILGDEAELVAQIAEGPETTIEILDARLTSPDLNLTAAGTYTRDTALADLVVALEAGPRLAEPFDGVDFGGLRFARQLTGAPGALAADGELVLDGLATAPVDIGAATLSVRLRQTTPPVAADGAPDPETTTELAVAGLTRGLRLDQLAAETIGEAELVVSARLTGDDLTLSRFALDSAPLNLVASGSVQLDTTDLALDVAAAAPDLAPVAAAYGVEGAGTVAVTGRVRRQNEITTADVDARLSQFAHPLAAADRLRVTATVTQGPDVVSFTSAGRARALRLDRIGPDLLPQARFDADGRLDGDLLDLTRLTLTSPLVEVTASGPVDLAAQTAQVRYTVATPDLAPVAALYDQPAAGALAAEGVVGLAGPEDAPQVTGTLSVSGLAYDGADYGRLDATHDVAVSEAPSGRIELSSQGSAYGPAQIATDFALDGADLTLAGLSARVFGVAATGDLAADLDGPLASGSLDLSAPSLAGLRPITGTALGGSGRGSLRLSAEGGRQAADLDLRLSALDVDGIRLGAARLTAAMADALGTPSLRADLGASDLVAGGVALASVSATVRGPLAALDITGQGTRHRR